MPMRIMPCKLVSGELSCFQISGISYVLSEYAPSKNPCLRINTHSHHITKRCSKDSAFATDADNEVTSPQISRLKDRRNGNGDVGFDKPDS